MPDARLQRTREAYQEPLQATDRPFHITIQAIDGPSVQRFVQSPEFHRALIGACAPFPPNREVRDGGFTPRLDALIDWLKRQAGRF